MKIEQRKCIVCGKPFIAGSKSGGARCKARRPINAKWTCSKKCAGVYERIHRKIYALILKSLKIKSNGG